MDNKTKIVVTKISILILILVVIAIGLLVIKKDNTVENISDNTNMNTIQSDDSSSSQNTEAPKLYTDVSLTELKSSKMLLALQDCVNNYYSYIYKKDAEAILGVLNPEYVKNKNINTNNVFSNVENISAEMNFFVENAYSEEVSYDKEYKYYIYGESYNNSNLEKVRSYMYIVYVNTSNSAFYIEPYGEIAESDFSQEVNKLATNIDEELSEVTENNNSIVSANNYNTYVMKENNLLTENIILNALKYYNFLQENDMNRQFLLLNESYRNKKFGSVQELNKNFKYSDVKLEYVRKSYDSDNNTIYIGIDTNSRYYIITEKSPVDFSIMLDSYTIPLTETTKKYTSATSEQKACMCIETVKEMINCKDYETFYSHLNSTFKSNNFKTIEDFTKYVGEKYYDSNNFTYESYETVTNSYVVNVKVSDNNDESQSFNISFVVKLGEGINDFEMSFEV